MKSAYAKYLTHLNLNYDIDELKEEVEEFSFEPFSPKDCYFHETWLKAKIRDHTQMYPHIDELYKMFKLQLRYNMRHTINFNHLNLKKYNYNDLSEN